MNFIDIVLLSRVEIKKGLWDLSSALIILINRRGIPLFSCIIYEARLPDLVVGPEPLVLSSLSMLKHLTPLLIDNETLLDCSIMLVIRSRYSLEGGSLPGHGDLKVVAETVAKLQP